MTVIAGVVGNPIGHSLSPVIHSAWIAAIGLDADYGRFQPESPDEFATLVDRVRAGEIAGLNVTAPFKEQTLALADTASETARACGAANLLTMVDGRLHADSTDGRGLMIALKAQAPGLSIKGAPVVILGAGGAARAAAHALKEAGAEVHVLNRTRARAETLAVDLGVLASGPDALAEAVLIVNALSVPAGIDIEALRDDAVLMDMTYKPLTTAFLEAGQARGLMTVDGLGMLVGQAGPSFRAIFGVEPPEVDVRGLCLKTLGETG